ncbi:HGGxSTG domain-containing protein [Bradyrhizobium sp. YR681]|uniref:HGGxSTG domain-containing protein n=1 Tax=Bradyrhizobium sp. YR681 TaxID=1144344 RepID=UPI0024BF4F8C|nr:HGGxSTG domain-containing protein [Bradyrhizobium sp. YR681]
MAASPRCGARTRDGDACRAPALRGKTRCRMHGGARRSGAPRGNRNARTHGLFTADAMIEQDQVQVLLDDAHRTLQELRCSPEDLGPS